MICTTKHAEMQSVYFAALDFNNQPDDVFLTVKLGDKTVVRFKGAHTGTQRLCV